MTQRQLKTLQRLTYAPYALDHHERKILRALRAMQWEEAQCLDRDMELLEQHAERRAEDWSYLT